VQLLQKNLQFAKLVHSVLLFRQGITQYRHVNFMFHIPKCEKHHDDDDDDDDDDSNYFSYTFKPEKEVVGKCGSRVSSPKEGGGDGGC
jgi:hypothetical protein